MTDWLPNRNALAEFLGCHANSISRWCKEFAGDPELPTVKNGGRTPQGKWHGPNWKAFADNRRLLVNGDETEQTTFDLETLSGLKRAREEEKLRRERRENEAAEGKLFTSAEIAQWLSDKGARITALIHQRLSLELPAKLAGLSAAEIADRMLPIERELVDAFRKPQERT